MKPARVAARFLNYPIEQWSQTVPIYICMLPCVRRGIPAVHKAVSRDEGRDALDAMPDAAQAARAH